jgi:hypothetical protein
MEVSQSAERSGDDWNLAGHELRRLDPHLYLEILTLTRRAVTAHKDPAQLLRDGRQIVALRRGVTRGSA